jgi:hypothetical protein
VGVDPGRRAWTSVFLGALLPRCPTATRRRYATVLAGMKRTTAKRPVAKKETDPTEMVSFASSRGVWLKIAKKAANTTSITYADALGVALASRRAGPSCSPIHDRHDVRPLSIGHASRVPISRNVCTSHSIPRHRQSQGRVRIEPQRRVGRVRQFVIGVQDSSVHLIARQLDAQLR